jgi:hypothetical protein
VCHHAYGAGRRLRLIRMVVRGLCDRRPDHQRQADPRQPLTSIPKRQSHSFLQWARFVKDYNGCIAKARPVKLLWIDHYMIREMPAELSPSKSTIEDKHV